MFIHECCYNLTKLGVEITDAIDLRRIAMTLHRWHELECGDGNDYASWCITRGRKVNGSFEHNDNGKPYIERHIHRENKARYEAIPDRERGASLYILPEGITKENYNRGFPLYK